MQGDEQHARDDAFVSVVVLVDEGTDGLGDRIGRLRAAVAERYRNYEIVVVENRLAPSAVIELRRAVATLPCLRVLRLARRSSPDTAVLAGLDAAIGDFVVVTAIAYDPPEVVPEVVDALRSGHDVVQGEHLGSLGGGVLTRVGRRAFYWYNRRFLDIRIPSRSTYLLGLSRTALNGVSAASRTHRYIRHLVRYIGYPVHVLRYAMSQPHLRRARTRPKWLDAIEMVSSYSIHPLRVVTVLGLLAGVVSFLYGLYVVVVALTRRDIAPGWTSISLELSAMFFVVMLVLAVQAEYMGRILAESRREAPYFITEEFESDSLIADEERRNVVPA